MKKGKSYCDEVFQTELSNIGANVKAFRKAKGIKQKDLAALVELEPASISRIEAGIQSPLLQSLSTIARALDKQLVDFFQPAAQGSGATGNGHAAEPVPDAKETPVQTLKPG